MPTNLFRFEYIEDRQYQQYVTNQQPLSGNVRAVYEAKQEIVEAAHRWYFRK